MAHMSSQSAVYNKMLSMAHTSFDNNSKSNKVERIRGPHSVTICGSPYSYIPNIDPSLNSGISYFTFDGLDQLMQHGNKINAEQSKASAKQIGPRVNCEILNAIYKTIRDRHKFAHGNV
jgi:hypothetical protein